MTIGPGEFIGITGTIGSGKSTLVNVLTGLLRPPRGSVFVGGTDIRDIEPAALFSKISIVSQSPFLFSRTLAENIAMGHGDGTADRRGRSRGARRAFHRRCLLPRGLRAGARRAGHHAVRRSEAEDGHRAGADEGLPRGDPRRFPVQRGRAHGVHDHRQPPAPPGQQDRHHRLAPYFSAEGRGPHLCPARREGRGAGRARRAGRAGRPVRAAGALPADGKESCASRERME